MPWVQVLVVPMDRRIPQRDRVRWAVTAHKALIKTLDRDSPPLLTGVYPEGIRRPANRVALHLLDRDHPVDLPGRAQSALAVLLPRDADDAELDAVYAGVGALRSLHSRPRSRAGLHVKEPEVARVTGPVAVVAGDRLWREPDPGVVRLWRTEPAAVPDTRGHPGWTFTHAALLSLGFVWQGLAVPRAAGRSTARDAAIIDAVNAAGAAVLRTAPVRRSTVDDYVHRLNPDAVARPYTATLHLGGLGSPTGALAIGQCRHLGGGLLVPDDHPEGGDYFA